MNKMSKPLARYADDEEFEQLSEEQERRGDGMLVPRRKKKKTDVEEVESVDMVEFMPDQFVRPELHWNGVEISNKPDQFVRTGYHCDGVDTSKMRDQFVGSGHQWDGVEAPNRYERRWLAIKNVVLAQQEISNMEY